MLGYLAEAAAANGCSLQQAQQLQAAAGLGSGGGGTAGDMLLFRLAAAISSNRSASLTYLKKNVMGDADVSYGQVKVGCIGFKRSDTTATGC